jgi:tRNA threonylcarbamoyladenosine biosynthesis protein TsaB
MLLAVDTSTAQMGLAVYDGAQVIAEYAWRSSHRHTVELAPAVAELLNRSGLKMDTIKSLGIALGPGSFTSLRVGLAFAKGLAFARQLPLIGIPTLDILAASQPVSTIPLIAALQAGRGRLAVSGYKSSENRWQANGAARVVSVEELSAEVQTPSILCGEFTADDRQRLVKNENVRLTSPAQSVRRPAILAELVWARWQRGEVDDAATLAPIYLHTAEPIAP